MKLLIVVEQTASLDGMREDGLSVPPPHTYATYQGFEPDDGSDGW